jgi:HD-like signal output (HDOD) protein
MPPPPTLDQVCERALRLPCSPALLPRLITLLESPDSSADQIADLIKVDSALAASTLRLANSAYFFSGGAAETVTDAIVRLGQRELFRLAALALVSRWEPSSGNTEPGDFCRHSLCTALSAELLAESSGRVDPPTAYTAGLVCDLGRLAIVHACGNFFPAIRTYCSTHNATWLQAERHVLGYTHTDVGGRLLRKWRFPPALITAAEFCEKPERARPEHQPLLAHLHAGKYIATSLGCGVSDAGFLSELNAPLLQQWGITSESLQEAMPIVHDRAKARLQDKLTHGAISI